jgi:hypothetical protein
MGDFLFLVYLTTDFNTTDYIALNDRMINERRGRGLYQAIRLRKRQKASVKIIGVPDNILEPSISQIQVITLQPDPTFSVNQDNLRFISKKYVHKNIFA